MGVIRRQGLKNSFVSFFGVVIGAISMLLIYDLDKDTYGYFQFIISSGGLLIPLANFGVLALIVKFKDRFDIIDKNGFFFLTALSTLGVFLLFIPLYLYFGDYLFSFLHWIGIDKEQEFPPNSLNILAISAMLIAVAFMTAHSMSMRRIVVPELLSNLGLKLLMPLLVLGAYFGYIDKPKGILLIIGFYLLVCLLLFIYLTYEKLITPRLPKWKLYSKKLKHELLDYSLFSSLNQLGATIIIKLDVIMVGAMMGFEAAGTYVILMFLANIIYVPYKSIIAISNPVISEAFEQGDTEEIKTVYKKSSIVLMIAGLLLFLLIWNGIENVFYFSKNGADTLAFKYVFFFLGLGKLIDLASGCNDSIIRYSKDYRWNLVLLLIAAGANAYLNFTFINAHGIVGAAIATAISLSLFNILKFAFLYFRMGLIPFSLNTFKLVFIGLTLYFIFEAFPYLGHPLVDLFIVSILIASIFLSLVYLLGISSDFNDTFDLFLSETKKRLKL